MEKELVVRLFDAMAPKMSECLTENVGGKYPAALVEELQHECEDKLWDFVDHELRKELFSEFFDE